MRVKTIYSKIKITVKKYYLIERAYSTAFNISRELLFRLNYLSKPGRWLIGIRRPKCALVALYYLLKYPRLFRINQITGNLIDRNLGILLYNSVLRVKSVSPNVVEVGAYKGASTCSISCLRPAKGTNG